MQDDRVRKKTPQKQNNKKRSEQIKRTAKPKGARVKKQTIMTDTSREVEVGYSNVDYLIVFVVVALVLFGTVMIFSASYYSATIKFGDPYRFFKKQLMVAVLGFIAMAFMANYNYNRLRTKIPVLMYAFTIFTLILVLFVGDEINGAKRWLPVPVIGGFQPSEIAKITTIIVVSAIISSRRGILDNLKGTIIVGAVVVLPVALIGIENMSTALIVATIGFGIIFIASPYTWQFIALGISGVAAIVAYLLLDSNFRGARMQAWFDPFAVASGKGFQTVQSLYAIGSGGLFGLGLGNSRQKLAYIPESHNDIIFAVICEELGLFGAIIVISLFIILIVRGIRVALNCPTLFGSLVASGIVIMIAVQVILNIAVVTATIPNTGVGLPFISYGGTSLIFTMSMMGILLNISRYTKL